MKLTREQTDIIIKNGQARGISGKSTLDALIKRGYEPDGIDVGKIKQSFFEEMKQSQIVEPKEQGAISRAFEGGVNQVKQGYEKGRTAAEKGDLLGLFEGSLGMIGGIAGIAGSPAAPIVEPTIGKAVEFVSDKIADIPEVQKFATSKAGEITSRVAEDVANLSAGVGLVAGGIGAPKLKTFIVNKTKSVVNKTKSTIGNINADNILKSGTELKNNIQLSIAKKNVSPQLESSANRLFLDGTKNLKTPVATYDKYLAQSKKAIGDIKADPAISVVGEKMGSAFETVVKQRQAIGKVLGDELKVNGKVKINITEPKTNLLNELKESGLSYNPKTNRLTSFQGSKFATDEVKMLNDFVRGVNKLGDSPTVSQIDNFISKTRSDLAFTKGKSGVIGTTNAERIINGGISKLRTSLNPTVNGNKALSKYWNANKTYSELSDFVDEGSTFLGKKTLSGDFAKDASVAKSSVQSILNQGKKDFMIKLEALTGYKAIDDAVLALQAMKDAGDFRGLSLLQAMSETGIPTSATGITQKILDYALSKGGEFIAGTPEQQTRALLQSL